MYSLVGYNFSPFLLKKGHSTDYLVSLPWPGIAVHAQRFSDQLREDAAMLYPPHLSEQHVLAWKIPLFRLSEIVSFSACVEY